MHYMYVFISGSTIVLFKFITSPIRAAILLLVFFLYKYEYARKTYRHALCCKFYRH